MGNVRKLSTLSLEEGSNFKCSLLPKLDFINLFFSDSATEQLLQVILTQINIIAENSNQHFFGRFECELNDHLLHWTFEFTLVMIVLCYLGWHEVNFSRKFWQDFQLETSNPKCHPDCIYFSVNHNHFTVNYEIKFKIVEQLLNIWSFFQTCVIRFKWNMWRKNRTWWNGIARDVIVKFKCIIILPAIISWTPT